MEVDQRRSDDAEGRLRRAVYLAPELWDWLEATAERDGTSRSDLLEGLVMLAMDDEEARTCVDTPSNAVTSADGDVPPDPESPSG